MSSEDREHLTLEEIDQAIAGMTRELAKGESGPYGVRYDADLATLVEVAKHWRVQHGVLENVRAELDRHTMEDQEPMLTVLNVGEIVRTMKHE